MQNPVLDDDAKETEDDQNNKTNKKHAVTGSEVVFGLRDEAKSDIKVTSTSECVRSMYMIYTYKKQEVTYTNLQRENHHCEANNCCDAYCHDYRVSVMEAGNHSHHVGKTESQDGLKMRKKQHQH